MKFAGKWIMLETVILSEATQTYEYHKLSLIGGRYLWISRYVYSTWNTQKGQEISKGVWGGFQRRGVRMKWEEGLTENSRSRGINGEGGGKVGGRRDHRKGWVTSQNAIWIKDTSKSHMKTYYCRIFLKDKRSLDVVTLQGNCVSTRHHRTSNKNLVSGMGYLFWSCWQVKSHRFPKSKTIANAIGHHLELNSNTVLLNSAQYLGHRTW